jgi:hypothetical protein
LLFIALHLADAGCCGSHIHHLFSFFHKVLID